jgi:8-oxo-dGTP pyrophosphatase MutT (NUDIX family)
MWSITKVIDEDDWFEGYLKLALSVKPPSLPAKRQKLGATSIQWFECEPGVAFIDTKGGTPDDRVIARQYMRSMLAGHGYRGAQYEIDHNTERLPQDEIDRLYQAWLTHPCPKCGGKMHDDYMHGPECQQCEFFPPSPWYVGDWDENDGEPSDLLEEGDPRMPGRHAMVKESKWSDIMAKAKRLIQQGGTQLLRNGANNIVGMVAGDHGQYQTEISRDDPNSQAITTWQCDCPWDQYAWQRTRQWKKYEGRPCSHVLATFWKSLATPLDEEYQGPAQAPGAPPMAAPAPGAPPAPPILQGLPGGAPMPPVAQPGQAIGTPPIPGMPPEVLPPFPMEGQLEPLPPQVSIPGAKPQTPLNPMQWPGGTYSSTEWEDLSKTSRDWTTCSQGHTHWGPEGAAGLMLSHTDEQGVKRYLLQHRSPYVHHGNTWSIPGGAIDPGESPEQAAHREASEEFGQLPHYQIAHRATADCGGWQYHTVHGTVDQHFDPRNDMTDPEYGNSEGYGKWFTPEEISQLPLHPGFAQAWHGRTAAFTEGFTNGSMVQILGTDMGIAEGPDISNPMHGQYLDIKSNTKGLGEVMGMDNVPGLGPVVEVIFPLDTTGELQPYHIRAWLKPEQLKPRPDIRKPGPLIKRRRETR